jgi:hypothetical protein
MTSPGMVSLFGASPPERFVCFVRLAAVEFFLAWVSSGLLYSVNYILQIAKENKIKQKSPVTFEITDYSECTTELLYYSIRI